MNILVVNQPLNNRGDESAHKALLRNLSKAFPQSKITVLFGERGIPDSIRQYNVNLNNVEYICVPMRFKAAGVYRRALWYNALWICRLHPDLVKIMNYYKRADLVVCAPGGICMGGFQDWSHMFFLKMAKYMHKPLVYYGRSFGPFPTKTRLNRLFYKYSLEMLHYFSFLSIRDRKTERLARELNIDYIPTVDSAFLETPRIDCDKLTNERIGSKYIVFVPNILIWHYNYRGKTDEAGIINFYSQLLDIIFRKYPNHKVVMLPQTFNFKTRLENDINLFNDIAKHKQDSRIEVLEDTYSSDIQQSIISKADCVIGARYHSIVFAINNNIPFVALSYEHKIEGLLETLNKKDCMIDITHTFDDDANIAQFMGQFPVILDKVTKDKEARDKAKHIAESCFDKLCEFIKKLELS